MGKKQEKPRKKTKVKKSALFETASTNEPTYDNTILVIRVAMFLLTIIIVGIFATISYFYARGYRFNQEKNTVTPSGLLVLKSVPDSAQIFIDGKLKSATDATISLEPGTYDVTIKKEGYMDWSKRLTIEKEAVTESTAYLFRSVPSLSATTFHGISAIVPTNDLTKAAYIVLPSFNNTGAEDEISGLWVMEMLNLPLGFSREPRRITDGNLDGAMIQWSPDGNQILLTTKQGAFLLDTNRYTPQTLRVNISALKDETLLEWKNAELLAQKAQTEQLPLEIQDVLLRKSSEYTFAPDEKMVMYKASMEATIPENLLPKLPGASTQRESRKIEQGNTYVYDFEEDRNFLVYEESTEPYSLYASTYLVERKVMWFPTSRHIVVSEPNNIALLDYDGTNRKLIYSGPYNAPHAYPVVSTDRLLMLTNFGSTTTPANLYSLSLR